MTSSETVPLSEDQQALQDTLRGFRAGQLPPAALRAALETPAGYSPELHARLAGEFGLTGLTIPREFGGLDRYGPGYKARPSSVCTTHASACDMP